ncbi:hypothetical protein PENTCL1PPCAC_20610, partial [Pristionchus entomophagus]
KDIRKEHRASEDEIEKPKTVAPTNFLDHESYRIDDYSNSESTTLLRMKRAYGMLCLMRKSGEMGTCSPKTFDLLQRGIIKFRPLTYATDVPTHRITYAGLQDFFRFSFDDFMNLPNETQRNIIFRNYTLLSITDNLYRSVHHFPDDDTTMPTYTTTLSPDRLDDYLIDCPVGINKDEAAAEIIKNMTRNVIAMKAHFKRVQLTSEEFLALLGLGLWNDHSATDDDMAEIVRRNRSLIMAELHKYYAAGGRADYADRLGDVLCLLVNIEEAAAMQKEDENVYLLMNMFEDYFTIIDRTNWPR